MHACVCVSPLSLSFSLSLDENKFMSQKHLLNELNFAHQSDCTNYITLRNKTKNPWTGGGRGAFLHHTTFLVLALSSSNLHTL